MKTIIVMISSGVFMGMLLGEIGVPTDGVRFWIITVAGALAFNTAASKF